MPLTPTSLPTLYTNPTTLVTSNLQLWLDASDTTNMTVASGNVSAWNDKSGAGNNTTSPTGRNPSVTTNTLNGRSVMTFSGSQNLTGPISLGGTTFTQFVVYSNSAVTVGQAYIDSSDGPVGKLCSQNGGGNQFQTGFAYGSSFQTGSAYRIVSTNCSNPGSSSTVSVWFNGTNQNIGGWNFYGAGTTAMTGVTIGARKDLVYFTGTIAEIIIYSSALSAPQQQTIEGYLAQKWGLTSSLPAGHAGLTSTIYTAIASGRKIALSKIPYYTAFSPRLIGGCTLWLDGADSATTTSITSGVWTDKSGGGFNTSYVAGGSGLTMGTINRIPAVTFPGGDNNAINSSAATSTANGFSIFFVASRSNSSPTGARFITNTSSSLQIYGIAPDIVSTYVNNLFSSTSLTIVTGVPFIFSLVVSPSTFSQWINGTVNSSTGTTGFAAGSTIVIGASGTSYTSPFVFAGQMGEILVFNSAITTTQRQQVESYLAQKWRLTTSLIAGHLNATFPAGSPTAIQSFVPSIRTALTNTIRLAIFSYTGSIQTYIVPAGKTSATIYIWGAAGGGDPYGNSGGAGAFITGIMPVTPGTTYYIVVGGGGRGLYDYPALYVNPGGYGGGGTGYYAAGGGGYSGIFSGLTPAQGNTLLLAGGGGGAGPGGYGGSAAWSGTAQAGGGGGVAGSAGQGATTSAGGAAGTPQTQGVNGTTFPGAALAGGNGCQNYGGAGGGGYWGGGGGTYNNGANGGGGGSSYSNPTYLSSVSGAQSTTGSGSTVAPGNTNPYYVSGVGAAGISGASGGNGLVVIN